MNFLKLIGAVSAAEHSKAISQRDETYLKERARLIDERDAANRKAIDFEAKFKRAVKDIAGLTDDVQAAEKVADARAKIIAEQRAELAALRPDAEKHRAKLERDRGRVRPSRAKAPTKAVAAKGRASK